MENSIFKKEKLNATQKKKNSFVESQKTDWTQDIYVYIYRKEREREKERDRERERKKKCYG